MLITTKRGKDQKPTVSLTANWQVQSPTRKDTYLDSYDSVVLLEEARANNGLGSQYSAYDIEMYKKSRNGQLGDWMLCFIRMSTGMIQCFAVQLLLNVIM
jgi:hypothetical protein